MTGGVRWFPWTHRRRPEQSPVAAAVGRSMREHDVPLFLVQEALQAVLDDASFLEVTHLLRRDDYWSEES